MPKIPIVNLNTLLDSVVTSNIAVQDAQHAVTNATIKATQAATSADQAAASKLAVDAQVITHQNIATEVANSVQENELLKTIIEGLESAIELKADQVTLDRAEVLMMLQDVLTAKSHIDVAEADIDEMVEDFHTKYLGASLEAPNHSWKGMELATGMIYYDIAKNSLMIYINANMWVPIIEAVNMLMATNNLADLPDKAEARTNLDVMSTQEVADKIQEDILAVKGQPLGLAELDVNGHVPASQLPSYVDDVIEVATYTDLPVEGETDKIYVVVADETSKGDTSVYRWTGTTYAMISNTLNGADVKALYESNADTNAFTDAEKLKLADTEVTAELDLRDIANRDRANHTGTQSLETITETINLKVMTATERTKLEGVEEGATADQTAEEIETLYEGLANTNKYTDAEKLKLADTEVAAQLDLRDAANRDRANHTGTQPIDTVTETPDLKILTVAERSSVDIATALDTTAITLPTAINEVHAEVDLLEQHKVPNKVSSGSTAHILRNESDSILHVASVTGAIRVKLKGLFNSGIPMSGKMRIEIQSNTLTASLWIGGYFNTSNLWTAIYGELDSKNLASITVRYAVENNEAYIYIGDVTSTWSYAKFAMVEALYNEEANFTGVEFDVVTVLPTIMLTKTLTSLSNVNNTSDADKPISTATQSALDLKADLDSPVLTGIPAAPTADVGTDTTQLATTAFVRAEIASEAYSKVELDAGQLDNRYYTESEIDAKLDAQNDASEINVVPSGNLVSTNVQDALDELQGDIDNRYTKAETDVLLDTKVDDSEIASVNLLRADKYLAAQNIANMIYTGEDLTKIQYNTATDVDYEVLTYGVDGLSNIAHYVNSVLAGNTILTYTAGDLTSAVYTGV